jgi:hypothetical protein
MTSTFKNALSLTGLSQREASHFLGVAEDTVKKWCQSKNRPPEGVWTLLAGRMRQILDAADFGADHINLDGIDPRAWQNVSVSFDPLDPLDARAEEMAGALALLMAVDDLSV